MKEIALARRPLFAKSWWQRFSGMMFRRFEGQSFDAMVFERCSSIHTCWMICRIDVLFLDRRGEITALIPELAPWRAAFGGRGAVTAVELPAGTLRRMQAAAGDRVVCDRNGLFLNRNL